MSTSEEGWVSLAVGLVAALITASYLVTALRTRRRRGSWTTVRATVVGHEKRRTTSTTEHGTSTSTYHVSRYRFEDASGAERTGTDESGDKRDKGATLQVMYDPDDPERSEAASFGRTNAVVLVVCLLALPLTLYALQWGLAAVTGNEPLVEWQDPRLLWLDEDQIQR